MFTASIRSIVLVPATIGTALLGLCATQVLAADASQWSGDSHAAARLVSGQSTSGPPVKATGAPGGPIFRAGVEIRLAPGWKTYWRYPGDSGVPPKFDFADSENVKSVSVLWPAPQLFSGADGNTIGYKTNVVLPLHVIPADRDKPVVLRMTLDYAVCEKLCIPAEAKGELALSGKTGASEAALVAAERRVPLTALPGKAGPLAVRSVRRDDADGKPRVLVDVAAPAGAKVGLIVEGPTPDWALPIPEPVAGTEPGLQRFAFVLDGLPTGASDKGALLKFTAVTEADAIETTLRLD
jgi:DsbC/DsbD-like thiol-disulfide interchange protein